ncbi:hypothetical protein NKI30_20560 [Mesorhizobium opportunistum]
MQAERLVTTESLRGFRVVPLSLDELRDAMSVRMMVETQALRAAIRNDDGGSSRRSTPSTSRLDAPDLRLTSGLSRRGITRSTAPCWRRANCRGRWNSLRPPPRGDGALPHPDPFGRLAPGRPRRASRTQRPKKNWLNLLDVISNPSASSTNCIDRSRSWAISGLPPTTVMKRALKID